MIILISCLKHMKTLPGINYSCTMNCISYELTSVIASYPLEDLFPLSQMQYKGTYQSLSLQRLLLLLTVFSHKPLQLLLYSSSKTRLSDNLEFKKGYSAIMCRASFNIATCVAGVTCITQVAQCRLQTMSYGQGQCG